MRGIDFKGNTSLADDKPLSSEEVTAVFSGTSGCFFWDVGDFLAGVSVEADDIDVFRSTWPKDPSKISNREDPPGPF